MTDLHSLLSQAAHADSAPAPDSVVDADLVRGRRALTHRRMRRTGTRSALAAVVAIGAFAAVHPGGSSSGTTAAPATAKAPVTTTAKTTAAATKVSTVDLGVKLVDYTGTQPEGYTVDSVPAGWEIQGVDNDVLTIAAVGAANQDKDNFVGKLVVMLQSKDDHHTLTGNPTTIGDAPGIIDHSEDVHGTVLFYTDPAGHRVEIQVPPELHWTDAEITAFGNSVHVSSTAVAGVG
jgi:hypothetical protein